MTIGGFQVGPYQLAYQQIVVPLQLAKDAADQPTLIPVQVPRLGVMNWDWLLGAYLSALVQQGRLGFEQGFRDGLSEGLQEGESEADLEEESGLEPDAGLTGKRKKRRASK